MTVIVAALNRQGVAVAADSAVTVGDGEQRKIFNSATKILTLDRRAPVAVAVHGAWRINGVPWESIVKRYRDRHAPDEQHATVAAHANAFLAWLDDAPFIDEANTQAHVLAEVDEVYTEIIRTAEQRQQGGLAEEIAERDAAWTEIPQTYGAPADFADRVAEEWADTIAVWRDERFSGHQLDATQLEALARIGVAVVTRAPLETRGSGLVFAGFGEEEFLPALQAWRVSGIVGGWARRACMQDLKVSDNDPALVEPFGQRPDVVAFLQGVDPGYQREVEDLLTGFAEALPAGIIDALDVGDEQAQAAKAAVSSAADERLQKLIGQLKEHREARFLEPISSTLSALPKDELGAMAQSLVNITSLRRRYSTGAETVGGPVDVAVITRGDGFVWIQRKHYFDREMNPQFAAKYLQ